MSSASDARGGTCVAPADAAEHKFEPSDPLRDRIS
jgi:hypothetical protein